MKERFKMRRIFVFLIAAAVLLAAASAASGVWAQSSNLQTCGPQYTVLQGEWLASIARKCGVTLQALLDANAQLPNPNLVFPGDVINIPQDGQGIPVTGATAQQGGQGLQTVTIQQGETLIDVAERLDVSLDALIRANPNLVPAGRVLRVPAGQQATQQPTGQATQGATQQQTPSPGGEQGGGQPTQTTGAGGAGGQPQTTQTPGAGGQQTQQYTQTVQP